MRQNLYKYEDSSVVASIDFADGLYEVTIDNVVQGLFKEMDDAAKYTSDKILKAMIEDVKSRDLVK